MELTTPKSTALHALVIELVASQKGELPNHCGRAIYAQVLRWIQFGNPELAQAIHDGSESPLSLSDLLTKKKIVECTKGMSVFFVWGYWMAAFLSHY